MKTLLAVMQTGVNEDAIHDVRVEFKKLRAILRLAGKIKVPQLLKELYAAAGRVRELQLQLHTMKQQAGANELPGYFKIVSKQLQFAIEVLNEKAKADYSKTFEQLLNKLSFQPSRKRINGFISEKGMAINSIIMAGNRKDDDIHEVRKLAKDLMYSLHNILLLGLEKDFEVSFAENKILHQLSDELGKFQDLCSEVQLLRLSTFKSLPEDEKKVLRQVRVTLVSKKQQQRKIILSKLSSLTAQNRFFQQWKTQ